MALTKTQMDILDQMSNGHDIIADYEEDKFCDSPRYRVDDKVIRKSTVDSLMSSGHIRQVSHPARLPLVFKMTSKGIDAVLPI